MRDSIFGAPSVETPLIALIGDVFLFESFFSRM
jgi:hypothetical protein